MPSNNVDGRVFARADNDGDGDTVLAMDSEWRRQSSRTNRSAFENDVRHGLLGGVSQREHEIRRAQFSCEFRRPAV